MKSGFVSIVGRPNVGKSTLLNSIIGTKIAITSNKAQTTRNIIQGIYNEEDTQIVFVDTPGIHKPKHKLGKMLNDQALFSINDVDIILFLVDITEKIGPGDKYIIETFRNLNKPVFLIINKIDKVPKHEILHAITEYKDIYEFAEIIPVSAFKNENTNKLIEVLKTYLKDNIKYFDDNTITSSSEEFIISEIIREKVLDLTEEEVPHSVACQIEKIEVKNKIMNIYAAIIIDRESLKKIIIGKQGSMIKNIGTKSRKELEVLLNRKVYLELYVKVVEKWRDKERYLHEFGFKLDI